MKHVCITCGTATVAVGTTQENVLSYIVEEGPIMPADIAENLGLSGPAVYQAVQRLRSKGFVCRPDPDKHNEPLRATPEGRRAWTAIASAA